MTTPADEFIVRGVRMHGRAIRSTLNHRSRAGTTLERAQRFLDPAAQKIKGSAKHRYLMPLDDKLRQRLTVLSKPYPKRERGVEGSTPVIHTGGGGSSPTRSLESAEPL